MSEQFKVGDDVIVVNDFGTWLDQHDLPRSTVLHVVEKHGLEEYFVDAKNELIEIEALREFPEDFQVVSKCTGPTEIEVKIGDTVEVLETLRAFSKDGPTEVGTVLKVVEEKPGAWYIHGDTIEIGAFKNNRSKFKLVPSTTRYATGGLIGQHNTGLIGEQCCETIIPMSSILNESIVRAESELGVYRPALETRKVGKVRVELVDDGFPLALREVAKVMTWAQTAKGYKDHDWQNLPNWEQQLAAATSRHRTDFIIQRYVEELGYDDCNDPESQLTHKAHEAFGVLAQLELMLRNKSK